MCAQYAPAAGKPGSTALRHDSSCFVAWANRCKVSRGYMDLSMPDSGYASVGDSLSACGPAMQNGVLSLGDGGMATLQFESPVKNGSGWDFAVFENTFLDSFLELAFVEVSSDGSRFVRFPAVSLTDTTLQTGSFGYTKPEHINNLAGKYIVGYGTPFDLEELRDSAGIDLNSITHVRVVDVVGSMNPNHARRDSRGTKINDPWPTRFPSSGFDLDAVGVIHTNQSRTQYSAYENRRFSMKNPVENKTIQFMFNDKNTAAFCIYHSTGVRVFSFQAVPGYNEIKIHIPSGLYYISEENKMSLSVPVMIH
ncbi:MAG: T9SS C-terminal target domain-containing protein [Bacteroidetes bacterium]|nr:T9SS C-terminal target domain-containing protein [Bacteroidota bacterium]